MEKFLTEIFTTFKEKISSPFFRYFTISWILWNYKFVYFIAFLDEKVYFDAHKITKFDYLVSHSYFYETWYCNMAIFFIAPLFSTWLMIFVFPIVSMYFFEEYDKSIRDEDELKHKYKKFIKEKDIELKELEVKEKQEEVKVVKEEAEKTKVTKKVTKEKKTLEITKFDEWRKEYEEFKNSQAYKVFNNTIEIVNFHDGYFTSERIPYRIQNNVISYLLANKIILKNEKVTHYHVFTEKGEYFAKLYFEETNK